MQNYSCKTCDAELYWDASSGCLKCKFCDSEFQPTDFDDATLNQAQVNSEAVDKAYTNIDNLADNMVVYECKTCGGEVVALDTEMATICPYCGEAITITSKSVGEFRPDLCIPFAKDKKEAKKIYNDYVSKTFLAPKAFKEQNVIEKIQGLYTPFFLHSLTDDAKHLFEGELKSYSKSGYDRVTTHKVFSLSIGTKGVFDRIPTDASKRIDNNLMDAIEPFDYNDCKEYNPAYMAGFVAEQKDDDEQELASRAEQKATSAMTENAKSQFAKYSQLRTISDNHTISDQKQEYAMLPVWVLNVKHNDKKYTYAINGQTGKIVGKLPMDKLKLFLIGGGSFVAIDLLFALFSAFFG